jgi:hypothetical protein
LLSLPYLHLAFPKLNVRKPARGGHELGTPLRDRIAAWKLLGQPTDAAAIVVKLRWSQPSTLTYRWSPSDGDAIRDGSNGDSDAGNAGGGNRRKQGRSRTARWRRSPEQRGLFSWTLSKVRRTCMVSAQRRQFPSPGGPRVNRRSLRGWIRASRKSFLSLRGRWWCNGGTRCRAFRLGIVRLALLAETGSAFVDHA